MKNKLKTLCTLSLFGLLTGSSLDFLVSCGYKVDGFNIDKETEVEKEFINTSKLGNYYHIFVPTFRDSNKDGIGDLGGVINALDYIRDYSNPDKTGSLNIDGIYLSPVFDAPSYHKYDATSYYKIDPKFGTDKLFDMLITRAHSRGIKVMLDMAFNHMSTRSDEFIAASKALKTSVCINFENNRPSKECIAAHPEVDRFRFFKGNEATSMSLEANGYLNTLVKLPGNSNNIYYESFSQGSNMADLNLENEENIKMIDDVTKYYIDKGIDGFRLDAVGSMFGNASYGVQREDLLFPLLTHMQEYANSLDPNFYIVAEGPWGDSYQNYLTNSKLDSVFRFATSVQDVGLMPDLKSSISSYSMSVLEPLYKFYSRYTEEGSIPDLANKNNRILGNFLSNHDIGRITTVFASDTELDSDERLDAMQNINFFYGLFNLIQGNFFLYYGDEIGQKDGISYSSDYRDTAYRTPMLWDDTKLRPKLSQVPVADANKVFITDRSGIITFGKMESQRKNKNSLINYLNKMFTVKRKIPEIQSEPISNVRWINKDNSIHFKGDGHEATNPDNKECSISNANTVGVAFDKGTKIKVVINAFKTNVSYDLNKLYPGKNYKIVDQLTSLSDDSITLNESNSILNMPKYSIVFLSE